MYCKPHLRTRRGSARGFDPGGDEDDVKSHSGTSENKKNQLQHYLQSSFLLLQAVETVTGQTWASHRPKCVCIAPAEPRLQTGLRQKHIRISGYCSFLQFLFYFYFYFFYSSLQNQTFGFLCLVPHRDEISK